MTLSSDCQLALMGFFSLLSAAEADKLMYIFHSGASNDLALLRLTQEYV